MKRSPSYAGRILLFFLITVFVTALILTLFSYAQYSASLKEKVYAEYQDNLKKNAQTWEDLSGEIEQLYSAIIVDSQSEAYFSMQKFDPVQEYNTFLKVKKLFNINPFMECFCLYNPMIDHAIYCGTNAIDLEELWSEMERQKGKIVLESARSDDRRKLLVYGYPVYVDSFEKVQGVIFLALDAQEVADHVFGRDNYGQLLFAENGSILLQKGNENDVISGIIDWARKEEKGNGNGTVRIGNETYLCSYYSQNGLSYLSYVNNNMVMEPLRRQRNIFLLVCFCVMAAGTCLQFAVVNKLYQPIVSIRDVFENSRFADGSAKNEFDLIRQVYEEAEHQIQELEGKNKGYLPRMKADILRNLITGSIEPDQAVRRIEEYDIEIPFEGMFIVSIVIDKRPENGLLLNVITARINQLLLEALEKDFFIECITRGADEVIALINNGKGSDISFEELVDRLEKIRDILTEEYDITLTAALDGVVEKAEDCRDIYGKVQELQKNRFALGENQIIYPARVLDFLPEPLAYPDKLMQDIITMMIRGEKKDFEEKVEDFLDFICQFIYTAASLIFARLYLELAAKVSQYKTTGKSHFSELEMKTNPQTRREAKQLLLQTYEAFTSRKNEAEQLRSNKHYRKVMQSQQFIQENSGDHMLGVDMIAERFGYSTNYFARVFKMITGYYINDYIRQVRVMKAQNLLLNTTKTISEIAEETGFTSSNYFYSIFKKETGMTPAAFRSSIEESGEE